MALCTSCGNGVDDAASFCTSCGQRMPSSDQAATITATRPICSSCGAQVDPGSVFCINCGQQMAQTAVIEETAPSPAKAEPAPIAAATAPSAVDAKPTPAAPSAVCRSCGAKLEPETSFCTICGQPMSGSDTTTATPPSVVPQARAVESATAEPAKAPFAAETAATLHAPSVTTPEDAATQPVPPTAPQIAPPIYATPSDYSPAQPGGGAFRTVVVVLLVIMAGAFGGWYFWGVETVIVCSPPDVRVFLDDKELTPESYGRYVIPHLSRQSHLLKVQRPGFADTLQRLDFSLTSSHEWVNIKLVPRQLGSPSRR